MDVNEELRRIFLGGLGRGGSGSGWGGQDGCEQRIEIFGKIQKKKSGGGGVRMDVNEELKFL